MSEMEFPEVERWGETQASMGRFWEQVCHRMLTEHPELVKNHLSVLEDSEPIGRVLAATSLHTTMDVIDARRRAEEAHRAFEELENEKRKLA